MDVRNKEFYPALLKVSKEAVKNLQKKGWELAVIYWQWGVALAGVETKYGEHTITSIAEDVGKDHTTVYRARNAAIKYPTMDALKEVWAKGKAGGREMSWHRLTRDALPAPEDAVDDYGGKIRVADQLMAKMERIGETRDKLKELVGDPELNENVKRQIEGVLEQVKEPALALNIEGDYMDYIRSAPCLQCEGGDSEPWVLTLIGVPEQTQFTAIPLCPEHYAELEEMGEGPFGETRLFGVNYYRETLDLCVRYLEATREDNS